MISRAKLLIILKKDKIRIEYDYQQWSKKNLEEVFKGLSEQFRYFLFISNDEAAVITISSKHDDCSNLRGFANAAYETFT
jgi:hypothetical protein